MAPEINPGDRVCSRDQGLYYRIPGTVLRVAQIQINPGTGLDYMIELDDGQTVILNEIDLRPVTDEDEARFNERELARQESERRAREKQERITARRLENERAIAEQQEQEQAQRMQDLNNKLQLELDAEQVETSRAIARATLRRPEPPIDEKPEGVDEKTRPHRKPSGKLRTRGRK